MKLWNEVDTSLTRSSVVKYLYKEKVHEKFIEEALSIFAGVLKCFWGT